MDSSKNSLGCPVKSDAKSVTTPVSHNGCPVSSSSGERKYDPSVSDERFGQEQQNDQTSLLSTSRAVSSIPRINDDKKPDHQPNGSDRWVYPSEQQYFNAIRRKGYNPSEADIPATLYIHNHVNEESWRRIILWEKIRANENPTLRRFVGRPKDVSPQAFINSSILG